MAEFGPLCLRTIDHTFVRDGLVPGAVNKCSDIVKTAFKWAASQEDVPASVHQALATVAGLPQGRSEARDNEPVGPVDDAIFQHTLTPTLHAP